MLQIAAGAEFRRNLQQLVQFMRLGVGRGVEFRVGYGDRAEAGNGRHQSFLFQRENAVLSRIDQDRALGPGGAKGSRDQHAGRNQIAQRVHVGANGDGDGFAGGDRALGQIRSETDGLAVVAGARRIGQLGTLGRDRPQFKRPFAT